MDATTALLIRARGLIERGWCRGANAIDKDGATVSPTSVDAIAWCASGALKAAHTYLTNGLGGAYDRLYATTGNRIEDFNDQQETVGPILAAFDRAITAGSETAS